MYSMNWSTPGWLLTNYSSSVDPDIDRVLTKCPPGVDQDVD